MNFDLRQRHLQLRKKARCFAEGRTARVGMRNDRREIFSSEILDALETTIYEGISQIQKLISGRHLTQESAFA